MALLLAVVAGYGVHLAFTAATLGWTGLGPGPRGDRHQASRRRAQLRQRGRSWLAQAGLGEVGPVEFASVLGGLFVLGSAAGALVFGGLLPAAVLGALAASVPVATYRRRRAARIDHARDAWPRLIEEIRILTGSAGRSVPQALFEVGLAGPAELRPAFEAAHREWLLSTDFGRTLQVAKQRLADPTADATCETLLIAHELGGTDLDGRLEALAEDRRQDAQGRKDARAHQAGVRFARRFVLIVPLGMAVVGLSVGNGRSAYETAVGQLAVMAALGLVLACWLWSGRIMRLPDEQRVFP
jgi:tight adherence protein B